MYFAKYCDEGMPTEMERHCVAMPREGRGAEGSPERYRLFLKRSRDTQEGVTHIHTHLLSSLL
tara:strand:- start:137 stop:325 length:189 start_codon:yes stop_codon:yes gene_type:complete